MRTRNWHAWLNLMPPKPDDFHVVGEIQVGNPGVVAELHVREPQTGGAGELQLDVHLVERPGMWAQVMTWVQARFDRVLPPGSHGWSTVAIFHDGSEIGRVDAGIVQ